MFFYGLWSDVGRPHTSKLRGLVFGIQRSIVEERAPSGKRQRFSPGGMSHATGFVFLDIDDQLGLRQTREQAGVLFAYLGQFFGAWLQRRRFRAARLGRERLELTSRAQPSPFDQVG